MKIKSASFVMLVFLIYVICSQLVSGQSLKEGYWSEWDSWSECSRSCGGGVTESYRECININITESEAQCGGRNVRYQMCNIQDCPEDAADFRMLQCSTFNNKPYKGKFFKWAGFSHSAGECELKCMPKNEFFYVTFSRKVIDGTKCNDFSPDVCINGTCVPVGCDKQLYSKARTDKCGICNGDESTCKKVKNSFRLVSDAFGYVDIVTIPAGATSITITEEYKTTNYLAVTSNGKNILNGGYAISSDYGTRKYEGLLLRYERSQTLNQIKIDGPLELPIQLHVYVAKHAKNPIIYIYEYYMPRSFNGAIITVQKYEWIVGDWSECSKKCASGKRTRVVYCAKKNTRTKTEEFNCEAQKPITVEECNTNPCPSRWYISQWSACSKSCGKGLHTRRVHCLETIKDGNVRMLDFSRCPGKTPVNIEPCYEKKACPKWQAKRWSKCSKSCGNGIQKRYVACVAGIFTVNDNQCPSHEKPSSEQICHNFPCGAKWFADKWTECSSNCGLGMRQRKVTCIVRGGVAVPRSHCNAQEEPKHFEDCQDVGPCKPMWHASEWSKCSAQCGYGMQMRHVSCIEVTKDNTQLKADKSLCDSKKKPAATRKCIEPIPCQVNYFVSKWEKCSASCGVGYQKRNVRCYADREIDYSNKHCANLIKPTEVRLCTLRSCRQTSEDNVVKVFTPYPATQLAIIQDTLKPTKAFSVPAVLSLQGPADVPLGQLAVYDCVAIGYPRPGVDWALDGKPIGSFFDSYNTSSRTDNGKIIERLVLRSVKSLGRKELRCGAANHVGSHTGTMFIEIGESIEGSETPTTPYVRPVFPEVATNNANPIYTPAVIVSLTGPVKLFANENADYQCAGRGVPPPTYSWTLNGQPIEASKGRVLKRESSSHLILFSADFLDTGELRCTVKNERGSDSSKLFIQVAGIPIVSLYPKRPFYREGSQVTITCKTSGSPTPKIQWGKGGTLFYGDNARVVVLQDRIIFKEILPIDSGKYFCKASNSEGTSVDSVTISIEKNDGTRVSTCVDDNSRADCKLIASLSRLCIIPHYSKVCCKTCKSRI